MNELQVRYLKQDPKFPVDEYKASMGTDLQYEDPTEGTVKCLDISLQYSYRTL